jgi:hypothetical protein
MGGTERRRFDLHGPDGGVTPPAQKHGGDRTPEDERAV